MVLLYRSVGVRVRNEILGEELRRVRRTSGRDRVGAADRGVRPGLPSDQPVQQDPVRRTVPRPGTSPRRCRDNWAGPTSSCSRCSKGPLQRDFYAENRWSPQGRGKRSNPSAGILGSLPGSVRHVRWSANRVLEELHGLYQAVVGFGTAKAEEAWRRGRSIRRPGQATPKWSVRRPPGGTWPGRARSCAGGGPVGEDREGAGGHEHLHFRRTGPGVLKAGSSGPILFVPLI